MTHPDRPAIEPPAAGDPRRHRAGDDDLVPYARFIPSLEDTYAPSVRGILSRGVLALYPVEPALRAIAIMVEHRVRTLPVIRDEAAGPTVIRVLTRRAPAKALKP